MRKWYVVRYQGGRRDALTARCLVRSVLVTVLVCFGLAVCWAQEPVGESEAFEELLELSIEELADIKVTSVAKKEQKLTEAAAAIFVITQEDIKRSGVTSIPEALRLAPGLQVARIDANKWAITSRGFNGRFANKLLVLIDGRSVYTPLFSGAYWDVQDVLLADIERIEVIRGPGATLWGANAVNGIINVITKHAQETQGGIVTAGGGTEERGFGGGRYGTKLGDNAALRVYAKYFTHDDSVDAAGDTTIDAWQVLRGGTRLDWQVSANDLLTMQGDVYIGEIDEQTNVPVLVPPFSQPTDNDTDISGGNVLARWQHRFGTSSDMTWQFYYDRTERDAPVLDEVRDTVDLDFQHRLTLGRQHEIVWGLGYRFTRDDTTGSSLITLEPDNRSNNLFSAFVQDDITLIENRLRLTLGSKFEHNDFTGFEYQPNARLLWTPHARHTVWTSVSRAVRTPSRVEDDFRLTLATVPPGTPMNPGPFPTVLTLNGDRGFESEEVLAYELGYRVQPINRLSFDIAAFFNTYDNLQSTEPGQPFVDMSSPTSPAFVIPSFFDNKLEGETFGVELAVDWRPLDWWRLRTAYSYLQLRLRADEESGDMMSANREGDNPHHQLSFRSSMNLPWDLAFDVWLRYVEALPNPGVGNYVTLDARLAWTPFEHLELSIVGQNLPSSHHAEFIDTSVLSAEVERSVYGKITWHF